MVKEKPKICQNCDYFTPAHAYKGLLGTCDHPLVLKHIGRALVNNTSEQLKCGKRGKFNNVN